jgi:hypothetical protein
MVALLADHDWLLYWALPTAGECMRIPPVLRDGVVFLYPTVEDAKKHAKLGGTAFLVGHKILRPDGTPTSYCIPYLVTNRHVAWTAPVIRVNRRDGGVPEIIEKDDRAWVPHPDGDDVAITPVLGNIRPAIHKISFGYTDWFITEEWGAHLELGVGDEVFMVGRFINHQGRKENSSAVRFGSISVMPEPIYNSAILKDQLSYAVEMRSRTGFSGSMVIAYRTLATVLDEVKVPNFVGILGVNWGYILDEDKENTWLNGVVPAWKIMDVFKTKQIQEFHAMATEALLRGIDSQDEAMPAVAMSEVTKVFGPPLSAPDSATKSEANPDHREDFTAVLSVAAKPKPKGDRT